MTTRVHIINFGPGAIEVRSESETSVQSLGVLYSQQSGDYYVYKGQIIRIEEKEAVN